MVNRLWNLVLEFAWRLCMKVMPMCISCISVSWNAHHVSTLLDRVVDRFNLMHWMFHTQVWVSFCNKNLLSWNGPCIYAALYKIILHRTRYDMRHIICLQFEQNCKFQCFIRYGPFYEGYIIWTISYKLDHIMCRVILARNDLLTLLDLRAQNFRVNVEFST